MHLKMAAQEKARGRSQGHDLGSLLDGGNISWAGGAFGEEQIWVEEVEEAVRCLSLKFRAEFRES